MAAVPVIFGVFESIGGRGVGFKFKSFDFRERFKRERGVSEDDVFCDLAVEIFTAEGRGNLEIANNGAGVGIVPNELSVVEVDSVAGGGNAF